MKERLAVVVRILLLAALAAGFAPLAPTAPAPRTAPPRIEIVFCLDTTGSMTGLLDGVRRSYWGICNQLLSARPTPELKVGVIAFRDKGDDYVTKVYDLRDDLDAVYLDLRDLSASGGGDTPEHINQALHDAVHKIAWSADKETLKILFLAGDAAAHMDYTDDVKYPVTCKKAAQKGIVIHAIQCGADIECGTHFADMAKRGGGSFVTIAQNGGVASVASPLDRRLAEIHARLCRTTLAFGTVEARFHNLTLLEAAEALPAPAAADRAGVLGKTGRVARFDLLDAIRAGRAWLDDVPAAHLSGEMEKQTPPQRRAHLDALGRTRAALLVEAHNLDRQRREYLGRQGEGHEGFDAVVVRLVRKQAGRRLRY